MAKTKGSSKKELAARIETLEQILAKLSEQLDAVQTTEASAESQGAPEPAGKLPKGVKPKAPEPQKTPEASAPEPAKPAGKLPKGVKPKAPEPQKTPEASAPEPAKPAGKLPKGFKAEPPKAEAPKPKPAETKAQPPATLHAALEEAYYDSPQTDFHQYRAKVTGYSPAANRYYVRLTAPVGKVKTSNWNDQKEKVTGYTQPSNQYFATRPRLAYHPPDRTFGGFAGEAMTFDGGVATAPEPAKPEPPKPEPQQSQAPPPQPASSANLSRKEQLELYEQEYLKRMVESSASPPPEEPAQQPRTRGTLPKGFEPQPEPEQPKKKGTLPKGF